MLAKIWKRRTRSEDNEYELAAMSSIAATQQYSYQLNLKCAQR